MDYKKNDELVVTIDRFGSEGEGIATVDGKVMFVPFAMSGEQVLVHIIFDKKNYYVGKLLKVITASPNRTEPRCKHFGACGGCELQHVCYQTQLDYKKDLVTSTLAKYAGLSVNLSQITASPKMYNYRNKFSFPVRQGANGEVQIGMFKKNSHQVVEVERCELQSDLSHEVVKLFKEFMVENNVSAYNEDADHGTVKHIVLREHNGQFILTVVVTDDFDDFDPLIQKLKSKYNSFGLFKNVNKLKNNVILSNLNQKLYGLSALECEENGITFPLSNSSFAQVNDEIASIIYKKIIEIAAGYDVVINAYSGAGLLSSMIAKTAKQVYGIEIESSSHKDAEALKQKNKLKNLTNICTDCRQALPKLTKSIKSKFMLVIDPPRKGVHPDVLKTIIESRPACVVYLSCNPATLARDLKILSEKYELKSIEAFDMFPQTANVETLVSLQIKGDE